MILLRERVARRYYNHPVTGSYPDPGDIEAHYRQCVFVKEICVLDSAGSDGAAGPLTAVVVPDMAVMRARKIVNVGDLLRFEMEGLSHALPWHARVGAYVISFEALPRATGAQIDRSEVARLLRERLARARQPEAWLRPEDHEWLRQPHAAAAVTLIRAHAKGRFVWPDANLELDLGLDSMERVELLMELEARFDIKVPQPAAAELFTVRQLVEVFRGDDKPEGLSPQEFASDRPEGLSPQGSGLSPQWAAVLRDLPAAGDPGLGWLLRKRTIAAPVLFVLLRIARLLLVRARVNGLHHLPSSGPYIITPNHQSYVDPFILCSVLPYRVFKDLFFVGAVEYFETAFTRWVAHTANLVPVDPDSNLVPAMQAGAFGLTHGKILMLFPEGERSIDGSVRKFKKGAPVLAGHLDVPMVPVALKGIHELWPRNRGINWRLVAPWSGHRVVIEIGQPLRAAGGDDDAASRLRERVNAMWQGLST